MQVLEEGERVGEKASVFLSKPASLLKDLLS